MSAQSTRKDTTYVAQTRYDRRDYHRSPENTAARVGAGGVEVFGTPMMIALMEQASWQSVANDLEQGYVTVGTLVNVRHLAATPLGQRVRATAELIEIDGRRLVFKVEAYDEKQKIGEGQHERFIVNLERFMKK